MTAGVSRVLAMPDYFFGKNTFSSEIKQETLSLEKKDGLISKRLSLLT
jgi:hypothetical protein